jgi:hypothetical protein
LSLAALRAAQQIHDPRARRRPSAGRPRRGHPATLSALMGANGIAGGMGSPDAYASDAYRARAQNVLCEFRMHEVPAALIGLAGDPWALRCDRPARNPALLRPALGSP